MTAHQYYYFAQAYGSGDYSGCSYNNSCPATSTGTASNSGLANTGMMVGLFVGVACLIIFIALAVRLWRRPKRAPRTPKAPDNHNGSRH